MLKITLIQSMEIHQGVAQCTKYRCTVGRQQWTVSTTLLAESANSSFRSGSRMLNYGQVSAILLFSGVQRLRPTGDFPLVGINAALFPSVL